MKKVSLVALVVLCLSTFCVADDPPQITVHAAKNPETNPIIRTQFGHDITWQHEGSFLPMPSSIQQITMARQAGFGGVVVYSYAYCSKPDGENPSLMDQLRTGLFSQTATLPAMGWK